MNRTDNSKNTSRSRFRKVGVVTSVVALSLVLAGCGQDKGSTASQGTLQKKLVNLQGESSVALMAGQHIDAGSVSASIDGANLVLTYETVDGWELTEAQAWVGEKLVDMPQTRKGNPKIGNFPHNAGDITGTTTYSFTVPLTALGGESYICGRNFLIAAHASMRKMNESGGYQYETGWGDGQSMTERGNWVAYFSISFTCNDDPPPPGDKRCETAFAFGSQTFIDLGLTNSRWGWQLGPLSPGTYQIPIYAAAGNNDISNGMHVGNLNVDYGSDGTVEVSYDFFDGYFMEQTHLYVGTSNFGTIAPGQYGHIHELMDVQSDQFNIGGFNGEDIYIVAHAVACYHVLGVEELQQ